MKKFKRAGRNSNGTDLVGTVLVKCLLYDKKGAIKGNIVTTIRVAEAKVSEVNTAIQEALFGDK